ncbi:MAG: glycolate oxidase subunit GlcE [Rhodospirillales bacterium]|nr:glycolate oxidase subunit GlcE [Rhodospirillales bacterium]
MTSLTAPTEETALAAAVAAAAAAGEPLAIQGNATKAAMLRPVQAARALSTAGLRGITLYSPKELVLRARAGTPLPEIESALAAQGQHLIAEPPDVSALFGATQPSTLGGIVAANLSGPRRVVWGAMRDHVLGVRAVNGSGEIIRSGGRVLKNVTGLDLCKLLTGSHGTLAVMTEITLKVLPAPESVGTVVVSGLDAKAGVAALSAALGSPYGVSGAAYLPPAAAARAGFPGAVAIARIEDFASSVTYRIARLRADLAGFGAADTLDEAASRTLWRAVRDATPLPAAPEDTVWRVSVRPSAGPAVLEAARTAGVSGFLDWGGGLAWLAGPASEAVHQAVCDAATARGGTWTLLRGPEPLRAAVAVVPPEPAALARITRQVKAAFDPRGILNPGRLYAGL